jgi:hypothetical protein
MLGLRHRMLIALPLIVIALAAAAYLVARYGPDVSRVLREPPSTLQTSARASRSAGHRQPRVVRAPRPRVDGTSRLIHTVLVGLVLTWAVAIALAAIGLALTMRRRFANRLRRHYERYPVNLTMHDEAKPKDLDDMIEAIANALRPPLQRRWREGQPFIAIELIHRQTEHGIEWMLCLLCERELAPTLEGIFAQAYPDVWLGRRFDEQPAALDVSLPIPGYVLRLRKRRHYLYPLSRPIERSASRERKPSSPLEGIARAQAAAGAPSTVRFQLMPVVDGLERRYRQRLHRRELRARRSWRGPGPLTLSAEAEIAAAVEVQDRALFHLELQVGAHDFQTANSIAASVMARRGENHLHRRYMTIRQGMYRRRFPTAYPPWLPPLSRRDVVSGGEIAYLFELPTARMKGVPVRRLTRPRIPAPPEMARTNRSRLPTCANEGERRPTEQVLAALFQADGTAE